MSHELELQNVTKQFGSLKAVADVSLTTDREGITAIIGPNGAGKTTLYNLMSGKMQPTSGRILLDGEDITDESPAGRNRLGLSRSFQITNIFEGLTVYENLRIPVIAHGGSRWNALKHIGSMDEAAEEIERILEMVGLEDVRDVPCDELSYGNKRRVEIGVTLASDPEIVLFDEPTAGLNPTETNAMVELIEELHTKSDTKFLLTEHDMDVVFSIASRIVVLHQGEILAEGTPEEIQQDERVRGAYLGDMDMDAQADTTAAAAADAGTPQGDPILSVDDIHTYYGDSHILNDVSLDVHEGEIVALLGRNGAGKTTTFRSIIGEQSPRRGEIRFKDRVISGLEPYQISRAGVGYVPEDRRLFPTLTVEDNLEVVRSGDSEWTIDRVYDVFPVLEDLRNSHAQNLSGGEQQMLAIGRALVNDPDLLLLDEPSEGLAPVIVEDLQEVLSEITETGIFVLLAEQNSAFAFTLASRGYILDKGRIEWSGSIQQLRADEDLVDTYLSVSDATAD